jgi:uncharacterized membrane protein
VTVSRSDDHPEDTGPPARPPENAAIVEAPASGYVQLIDRERLLELARQHGVTIYQDDGIGEFVVEGNPLVWITPPERLTSEMGRSYTDCFELGTTRTMQQDVHYGIRQMVDMALKAISPAVNDPTTASTCIDQLGRTLSHLARRRLMPIEMRDSSSGRLLMVRRSVTFQSSVDLAFNQLRQYGRADMAVSLRMLRALTEITLATEHPPYQERALHHARLIERHLNPDLPNEDCHELAERLRRIEGIVARSKLRKSA